MNSNLKDKLNKAPEKMVKVSDLVLCPLNPRKVMGDLKRLGESLQEKQTDAIIIRPRGSEYEIVAGTRRSEASRLANIDELRAKVADLTDDEVRDIIATQDEHSLKMTPLERGLLYSEMRKTMTEKQIADVVDVSQPKINAEINLAQKLPASFIKRLIDGTGHESKDFKTITTTKGITLAQSGLSMTEINTIGDEIEQKGMTHRDVIHKVKELKGELHEKLTKEFYDSIIETLTGVAKKVGSQVTASDLNTKGKQGGDMVKVTLDPFDLEKMPQKRTKKLAPFELGKDIAPTLEEAKKWVKMKGGNPKTIKDEDDYWVVSIPEEADEE